MLYIGFEKAALFCGSGIGVFVEGVGFGGLMVVVTPFSL